MLEIELKEVAAGDDSLAWFWALGDSSIQYYGEQIDFAGNWDCWTKSILDYLSVFSCPVIREHDRTGEPLGLVRRGRVLTRIEAAELGIDQEHDRALYLGVEWLPAGADMDNRKAAVYVSIGADFDWQDEHGETWPCVLKELSLVTVPYLKRGQIERPALAGITLSEDDGMNPEMMMQAIQGLADMLARIEAKLEMPATEEPAAEEPAADAEATDTEEPAAEMEAACGDEYRAEMTDRIAALEREIAVRDARAEVAQLADKRVVPDDHVDRLVSLRLRDAEAFGIVIDSLPERPAAEDRIAGVSAPAAKTVGELALSIRAAAAANGNEITFAEAAQRASAQLNGVK